MKKILYSLLLVIATTTACSSGGDDTPVPSSSSSGTKSNCGSHNGKQLFLGPQGGCYYINSNGNKEYVSRSECNC
jgi:hypothetical protein